MAGPGPDTDPAQVHRKSSSLDNVNLQAMIIMMIIVMMIMMIMMSNFRASTSSKLTGGRASVCSGGWRRPLRRRWRLTEVKVKEVIVKEVTLKEVKEVLITSR